MNENTKAIVSTVTIVACLGLIGFLVHEKVDGSYALALAVVPIVIAYFTRSPQAKDPPVLKGIIALAAAGSLVACLSGCASGLGALESVSDPQDNADLSRCRQVGRDVKADGGQAGNAYWEYMECTREAGLR